MRMSVLSTDYVKVPVSAVVNGQGYNPTADTVTMAFPATNAAPVTFYSASWETAVTGGITTYFAICLVGPRNGGVPLARGTYLPWVDIVDNPTVPFLPATAPLVIF